MSHFTLPAGLRPTAHAFARIILPDDLEQLGIAEEVIDELERSLESFPPHLRYALVLGMTVFDAAGAFYLPGHGRTFTHMAGPAAKGWFDLWWDSSFTPVAQFPRGIKALLALAYYEHPTVRARLQYDPDAWIGKVARRRVEKWADAIRQHEAMVLSPNPLIATTATTAAQASPADAATEGASAPSMP